MPSISGLSGSSLSPLALPIEPQHLSPILLKKLRAQIELIDQLSCLSPEDKALLNSNIIFTMKEDEIPEWIRFPFHFIKKTEDAKILFEKLESDPSYLNEILPYVNRSPAMYSFCAGHWDISSYYIEKGGCFEIEKNWHRISPTQLLFDYPAISQVIREAKWKEAKSNEAQITVLQEILEESCHKGNLPSVEWALNKLRLNGIPGTALSAYEPLEMAILGGFNNLILRILPVIDIAAIAPEKKSALIDLALEMGYPEIVLSLGFPLSANQQHKIDEMMAALKQNEEQIIASAPVAINSQHAAIHGGANNEDQYKKEYRAAVAYALNYIRNKGSFKSLIENLGHRRRRMAALGNLKPLDQYGLPQPAGTAMQTPFGNAYASYAAKADQKYGPDYFNVQALYTVPATKTVLNLSKINPDRWVHPYGAQREEVLNEVDRLCQATIKDDQGTPLYYCEPKILAEDLALIHWLISQNAPFSRGTPTIVAVLIDALWIYHGFKPFVPEKGIDLVCEALINIHHEEFVRYYVDLVAANNKPTAVENKE